MKKSFLLLAAMLLCSISMSAKAKIVKDYQEGDSIRIVETEVQNIYTTATTAAAISTGAYMSNTYIGEHNFFYVKIMFNEGVEISKDNSILIKLEDETIIELKNNMEFEWYQYGSYSSFTFAYYPISEEQIQQLMNGNVTKIRVQTDGEVFDRVIKSNKFSKAIASQFPLVKAEYEKGLKDIRADF